MLDQEGRTTRRVKLSLMIVYEEQIRQLGRFLAGVEEVLHNNLEVLI